MPFGLCNALARFQRCMIEIFNDMVNDFVVVFIHDFSVFGESFELCLINLDRVFARCEETNMVLNWMTYHFLVREGIVLGTRSPKVRWKWKKANVVVIEKSSPPITVKGV